MSKFKLSDRGARNTILLIPGWATDCRIFDSLDMRFNYLMPTIFSPIGFTDDLMEAMKDNGIKKISILGWSMGAFIACDIMKKHRDIIDEVILAGARKKYEKTQNEKIKTFLVKNRKGFLYKFYQDCFSGEDSRSLGWFEEHLLKDYLEVMSLEHLVEGLDYLSEHHIDASALEGSKVTFIHGREDRIAPIEEAMELVKEAPQARGVWMEKSGHIPFLSQKFKRVFNDKRAS